MQNVLAWMAAHAWWHWLPDIDLLYFLRVC
jgi:hypothetical protein